MTVFKELFVFGMLIELINFAFYVGYLFLFMRFRLVLFPNLFNEGDLQNQPYLDKNNLDLKVIEILCENGIEIDDLVDG